MSVLTFTVLGVVAAFFVLWRRRHKTVGFYRHILVGAVFAAGVGLLYSAVAKIGLDVLDTGRFLLTFVGAIIAVYLSVTLADAAQNYRMR
jgi:uncharacterized membrane protein YeaQ/YmgE (transglycosylase-associated protein family)